MVENQSLNQKKPTNITTVSHDAVRQAQIRVAEHAEGTEELHELLGMLGILPDDDGNLDILTEGNYSGLRAPIS